MECPYCHQEMQKGSITESGGRSKLYWQPEGQKLTFFDKLSGTGVIKAKYTLASFTIEANYCTSCKKIIFDTDIEK